MAVNNPDRLQAIADFVRNKRNSQAPSDHALPSAGVRRTKGLRREELGQLAGMSADWIARIEQARDVQLSAGAASRLAAALKLNPDETDYLKGLVGSPGAGLRARQPAPASLPAIIEAQRENPAYVSDQDGNVILWNGAAGLLFDQFGRDGIAGANLLRFMFLEDTAKQIVEWMFHARRMVAAARLRQVQVGLSPIVQELRTQSPLFDELWRSNEVMRRPSGRKTFLHPTLGRMVFDHCSAHVADAENLTLTLMTLTAESRTRERVEQLANATALAHLKSRAKRAAR